MWGTVLDENNHAFVPSKLQLEALKLRRFFECCVHGTAILHTYGFYVENCISFILKTLFHHHEY